MTKLILTLLTISSVFLSFKPNVRTQKTIVNYTKGLDVSRYQGKISWSKIDTNNIKFVFIKSTEGSTHKDNQFNINLKGAQQQKILVSAYHRFSLSSSGKNQFENYRKVVPKSITLPPSIDLENLNRCPENKKKLIIQEIKVFSDLLYKTYGKKPIFYLNEKIYYDYIKNNFNNVVWVFNNKTTEPALFQNSEKIFWQFTIQGKISGITGFVDLNYFKGTKEDLKSL